MYSVNENNWRSLLDASKLRTLVHSLVEAPAADVAQFLCEIDEEKVLPLFRLLPKDHAAEVFSFLDSDLSEKLVSAFGERDLSLLMEELFLDDAVDLIEELPASLVKRVLHASSPEKREQINRFLNYPEDSAGSVMTAEFLDLKEGMTATEAMAHIRKTGLKRETVYVCYCIDKTRHLIGVLDFVDLLYAEPHELVGDLMDRNVVCATTTDDREQVAEKVAKYDLLALPVVDGEGRLVGIVTVDDAMDVVTEEATEDMERMAALSPSDTPYLKTGVFAMFKNRILWLFVLMLSGMLSGAVMGHFEAAIATLPLLVTFTPMLTGTGGNAGAQSATLVIRGMSLSEIHPRDWLKVLWKEVRVSLLVGISLGALNYVRVLLFYPSEPEVSALALTLGISMLITVVIAKSVGCLLPIAAKRIGLDPAVMASPLVTTIVDSVALLIFFAISMLLVF